MTQVQRGWWLLGCVMEGSVPVRMSRYACLNAKGVVDVGQANAR